MAVSTASSQTKTERFRVHIHYPYHGPVAYVQLIGTLSDSPSTAIQVVREYLKDAVDDLSEDLVFSCIGPSPFHADFQLVGCKSRNASGDAFVVCTKTGRGYADITFQYCSSEIDPNQAPKRLFDELDVELGFFYDIKDADRHRILRWREIREKMSSLTEHFGTTGFLANFRSIGSISRLITELYESVTQVEINEIFNDSFIKETYQYIYGRDESTYLEDFIKSEIDNRPIFPTKQVTNLLSLFESRRSKSVELLVFLAAAVCGGAVGSFITLLFGPS